MHLKLDTGMGRLGVRPNALPAMLRALRSHRAVVVEALMTHLACADGDDLESTRTQLALFDELTRKARDAGLSPTKRHAANSAAMLRLPLAQLDLVRPGVALFGVHPCPSVARDGRPSPKLQPVMRVLTEVVSVRDLEPGERIGYGHTWTAARPTTIATLAMGYADGLDRALSNKGHVLIQGKRAPIVGTVSMDLTMVDVTDLPGTALRDEAVVLGPQRGRLGEGRHHRPRDRRSHRHHQLGVPHQHLPPRAPVLQEPLRGGRVRVRRSEPEPEPLPPCGLHRSAPLLLLSLFSACRRARHGQGGFARALRARRAAYGRLPLTVSARAGVGG